MHSLFALSPAWEQEFLFPSMTFHTANALLLFVAWIVTTFLTKFLKTKKKKFATGLLLDKLRAQDIAGPLSGRITRVLGPISRHRIADNLLHMKLVSRASCPGLLVGFLRILCNGLCIAQRLHTAENDHTCRIGCPDAPDSLSHYNECPRLHNLFLSGDTPRWRHKEISCYTT